MPPVLPDKIETWGNETTMNLNNILHQNIIASGYFKSLFAKKTYHEIIDEIYERVDNLEPFLRGTNASSAFCLLYKLWTIRLTAKQIKGIVNHVDSPHIRALGFLYLRYVCKPADLWDWFEPYLEDNEDIQLVAGPKPKYSTIGQMCIDLLTEQKFLGTQLPRIPVPVARVLEQKLGDKKPKQERRHDRSGGRAGSRDHRSSHSGGPGRRRSQSRSRSPPRDYRPQDRKDYSRDFERDRDRDHGRGRERGRGYRY